VVENAVWQKVRGVLENPKLILAEVQKSKQVSNSTSVEQEIIQKQRELENNMNAERRLVALVRYGVADADYVLDQIIGVKKERREIKERLSQLIKLKEERQSLENAEIKLDEFCSTVRHNLDQCDVKQKRLALDALNIKVKAIPEQIEIRGAIPLKFSSTEQTWA
jgi:vacuolar-type H+-ATPase subunit I/STV1